MADVPLVASRRARACAPPRPGRGALAVLARNFRVWRKLTVPSLLGNFADPLLYILGLGLGLGRLVGSVDGLSYVGFLASGVVCSSAMTTASFEGMYSAYTRMAVQRTWDGMLVAPLSVDDVVAGEALWAACKALISASAILVVAAALGVATLPGALYALGVAALVGLTYGSLALVMTALAPSYDFFMYYFTLFVTPTVLASGVFFPLEGQPQWFTTLSSALPLAHAVALARPWLTGTSPQDAPLHLAVLVLSALLTYALAAYAIRRRLAR
jgi:lipooligosaccharide transport system permease protein